MNYQLAYPSKPLIPFILRYYQVNGIGSESQPYEEFTLPNGLTSLVFHFGEKIVVNNVKYDGYDIPKFYVFGKYTQPVFVRHTFGEADVFGVIFQPAAFHYFLPVPQQELTDVLVDVRDGLGKEMDDVLDQMYEKTFSERIKIIEQFFQRRLAGREYLPSLVDRALFEILQTNGKIQVHDMVRQFKVSRQHLNRVFVPQVGLSVKEFARIYRFNQGLNALSSAKKTDLLQIAVEFGYHDASHLIKDFHHFTSGRPSDFLSGNTELAKFLMNK